MLPQALDYTEIQSGAGKSFMVRFLPYLELADGSPVADVIGYQRKRRGYGYGSWEECFKTFGEARNRFDFLIKSGAIETCELLKERPNGGLCHELVDEWKDAPPADLES